MCGTMASAEQLDIVGGSLQWIVPEQEVTQTITATKFGFLGTLKRGES